MRNIKNEVVEFQDAFKGVENSRRLEEVVHTRQIVSVLTKLSKISRSIEVNGSYLDWREICSRLSNLLTKWSLNDQQMSTEEFLELLKLKPLISSIYKAGFDYRQRTLIEDFTSEQLEPKRYLKMMTLISINNLDDYFFKGFTTLSDQFAFFLAVGWLSERTQFTQRAKKYHQELVFNFDRFSKIKLSEKDLILLVRPYMFTTYSNSKNKDTIKNTIHRVINNSIAENVVQLSFQKPKIVPDKKLRLVFFHEYFSDNHVMLRCFGAILEELEIYFEIFHVTCDERERSVLNEKFKNIVQSGRELPNLINSITSLNPDVLVLPSVGMSIFGIILAGLRLAPIQLQCFGHPSSSHSPEIDGSVSNYKGFNNSGPEQLTVYDGFKAGIPNRITLTPLPDSLKNEPSSKLSKRFNIAVNAKILKLSPDFIAFLRQIDNNESVTLNFYPSESGLDQLAAEQSIQAIFPTAIVHPHAEYESFMRNLAANDLALCPFPFGNTNGILDCVFLGLPVLVLRGKEICSLAETALLETMGLQKYIHNDPSQIVDQVAKLIKDDRYLESFKEKFFNISQQFLRRNNVEQAARFEAIGFRDWILSRVS